MESVTAGTGGGGGSYEGARPSCANKDGRGVPRPSRGKDEGSELVMHSERDDVAVEGARSDGSDAPSLAVSVVVPVAAESPSCRHRVGKAGIRCLVFGFEGSGYLPRIQKLRAAVDRAHAVTEASAQFRHWTVDDGDRA